MVALLCWLALAAVCLGQTTVQIYDGSTGTLVNGFENWSWATVNLQDTTVVNSGSKYSISEVIDNWEAFYVHGAFSTFSQLLNLHFSVNGGSSGNEPVAIKLTSGGNQVGGYIDLNQAIGGKPLPPNQWIAVNISFSLFSGIMGTTIIDGIWWEANSATPAGTIYLDDISFTYSTAPPPPPPSETTVINVKQNVHSISKAIFGVNFASAAQLQANKYTVNRWGGNAVTRYSWDLDTQNHASDWYFEDIPNDVADPSKLPYGSSSDAFINDTLNNGAKIELTIPQIGWSPFDRNKRCGFSVSKYGSQQSVDPYDTDCGNGINPSGTDITGNDPTDTSKAVDPSYVTAWLDHIEQVFGSNLNQNTVLLLDNEPCLWDSTHRDVHPKPLTYDELWNITQTYTTVLKSRSPTYATYGPVFWGWCAYMYSPADGCSDGPDREAHGDLPFLEWYTKQVGDYRSAHGVTLVDVIDVHFYPQAAGVTGSAEDSTTAGLRLRSTRSLWDPTYVDESWINTAIDLIPRMQGYVSAHAAGLGTSISEYNFGADTLVTAALANAEALAIFAREGLTAAARWVCPTSGTIAEDAFALFLNYDGQGANLLGTNSCNATTTDIDTVGSYAFVDSKYVYVVLIYKSQAAGNVTVDLSSAVTNANADVYQFYQNHPLAASSPVAFKNGVATLTLPGWSASLLRVLMG